MKRYLLELMQASSASAAAEQHVLRLLGSRTPGSMHAGDLPGALLHPMEAEQKPRQPDTSRFGRTPAGLSTYTTATERGGKVEGAHLRNRLQDLSV